MSEPDLAALTEAEQQVCRVNTGGACDGRCAEPEEDHCDCFGREPAHARAVVRAVLEALPREWAVRHDNAPCDERIHRGPWSTDLNWVEPQAGLCGGCYVVWRAVGPPIPAEEGSPRGSRHVLQPKPPGAGGGRMPGVGWMCSGCEWRFSYDVDESRVRVVWQNDERHALPPVPADEPQDAP